MPTEGNINRVSSPGLDRELAKLSGGPQIAAHRVHDKELSQSKGVIQSSQEVESDFAVDLQGDASLLRHDKKGFDPQPVQTAEASRAEHVGKAETVPDEEPVSIAAVTKLLTEHFAGRIHKEDSDLAEFKSKVIQAFKHLGLDTRKFFGA